ncbi:flagellar hook-length control protein FliK, partial [bacterium]|nr:flagellar hook-length control protein FliK [bacterium]
LNAKPDENISVKQEVKLETNINLNVEETNNIAVESADIKDVNADLVKETAQKDEAVKEDIDTVQQVKQVEIVSQVNTDVENKQAVKDEAVSFQVKEIINEPVTKAEELKQEIDSAKLENIANNVQNQTDKKVADKNAKTIVESDETMDIKEDVSGIEFVNNKTKETDLKQEKTNDIHSDKIKQKVENVKIQVEENVKVNPQLVKTSEDINNAVKAQETLNKAGLTTENLQKMDAKIKDIDFSKNNAQSDLGQSSQEMLMRDMMQDSAQNPNSEAVELKVDFNQSLNKVLQANNTQQNLHPQEELQDVNILDQIRAKISLNGTNGMQKITIGLTPESLGKLHIEISKGMNGISAQIIADNPQAKEILDKNLDGLRSVLQSQGVNVNNVNVKVAEAGRSSEGNNNLFSNDEGQFNSNNNSHGSKNSSEGDREKRSEYEHLQQEAIKGENIENNSEPSEKNIYTEKTVSIKLNNGNVKYQL